mmetsp:Transcript_30103/g.48351  ORF Transcript_30103/g.48351 Transcript_30103/m.48351 type:complete len:269 (+) Transcript_30103:522-1328(+)
MPLLPLPVRCPKRCSEAQHQILGQQKSPQKLSESLAPNSAAQRHKISLQIVMSPKTPLNACLPPGPRAPAAPRDRPRWRLWRPYHDQIGPRKRLGELAPDGTKIKTVTTKSCLPCDSSVLPTFASPPNLLCSYNSFSYGTLKMMETMLGISCGASFSLMRTGLLECTHLNIYKYRDPHPQCTAFCVVWMGKKCTVQLRDAGSKAGQGYETFWTPTCSWPGWSDIGAAPLQGGRDSQPGPGRGFSFERHSGPCSGMHRGRVALANDRWC